MTMTRRDAVASFALFAELLASSRDAGAQRDTAPATPRPPVFKHDLPNVSMEDWEVTVSHVDYPPGRVGGETTSPQATDNNPHAAPIDGRAEQNQGGRQRNRVHRVFADDTVALHTDYAGGTLRDNLGLPRPAVGAWKTQLSWSSSARP